MTNYSEDLVKYIKELLPVLNYCVVNPVSYNSANFNPMVRYNHGLSFTKVIIGYEVIIDVNDNMDRWNFTINTGYDLEEVKKNLKEKIDEYKKVCNIGE